MGQILKEFDAQQQVERVVAIDWSGRIDVAGQRRHIWAGVWTAARDGKPARVTLEAGRTREELIAWLIELAEDTPRMVVGVDCCFSYPAWFLREHRCKTVFDFWRAVAAGKGEDWLHRDCADDRFWGKGGPKRPGKRPPEFCGDGLRRMMRLTDWDNKIAPRIAIKAAQEATGMDAERAAKMFGITPKSPFQIGGSGSVGTGSLRAMPFLLQLSEVGFLTWPFEAAAFELPESRPLLVEIYTRLLTGPVAKSNAVAREAYLTDRRKSDPAYAAISRSVITKAKGSEDGFDALICAVEMARHHAEFPTLSATTDPTLKLEGITWRPGVI